MDNQDSLASHHTVAHDSAGSQISHESFESFESQNSEESSVNDGVKSHNITCCGDLVAFYPEAPHDKKRR